MSLDPEASRVPSWSKVKAVTAARCPLRVTVDVEEEIFQRRIDPSLYLNNGKVVYFNSFKRGYVIYIYPTA